MAHVRRQDLDHGKPAALDQSQLRSPFGRGLNLKNLSEKVV